MDEPCDNGVVVCYAGCFTALEAFCVDFENALCIVFVIGDNGECVLIAFDGVFKADALL